MSPHKDDSELSRINRDAGRGAGAPSATRCSACSRGPLHFSRLSDGAFDITYASVGHLYDYRAGARAGRRRAGARARRGRLAAASSSTRRRARVRFARDGMRIDLGGFAKGHAVDNAARRSCSGSASATPMVSAGGDSRVIGDRRGRPWTIGDPRSARRSSAWSPCCRCEDVSISTSGDYERYFERDGVRYHHLIDPATGTSPRGVRSVTMLADDGLTSEALSKAVFVLGVAARHAR